MFFKKQEYMDNPAEFSDFHMKFPEFDFVKEVDLEVDYTIPFSAAKKRLKFVSLGITGESYEKEKRLRGKSRKGKDTIRVIVVRFNTFLDLPQIEEKLKSMSLVPLNLIETFSLANVVSGISKRIATTGFKYKRGNCTFLPVIRINLDFNVDAKTGEIFNLNQRNSIEAYADFILLSQLYYFAVKEL